MKKLSNYMKIAALAMPLLLASCGTHKKAVKETPTDTPVDTAALNDRYAFLQKVNGTAHKSQFVTSKVKFTVEVGPQQMTLTGNLKMKRDDVIRLRLMAFGFVEAARIEFTKDYVLVMDRINKLYLRQPYRYIDFLRNTGIDFNTLQALFWDELFLPGEENINEENIKNFTTYWGGEDAIINIEPNAKMSYSWLANQKTGRIKMANISYHDKNKGDSQLNWDYRQFDPMGQSMFPTDMLATLTIPQKEVKMGIKLSYLNDDSEWETRTNVSDKYREVEVDEILRRFMAL